MTFFKKAKYHKLVEKLNSIDTSGFVLKTKHGTYTSYLQSKIIDADKKKYLILVELLKNRLSC